MYITELGIKMAELGSGVKGDMARPAAADGALVFPAPSEDQVEDSDDYFHELDLMAGGAQGWMSPPRPVDKEKQIGVDPISLLQRESSSGCRASSFKVTAPEMPPSLPVPPISFSLPASACSSPRFSFAFSKKKISSSKSKLGTADLKQHLQRSKSCGEGRWCSPADELDLLFTQFPATHRAQSHSLPLPMPCSGSSRRERQHEQHPGRSKTRDGAGEGYRCGGLSCLYLPGFGKANKAGKSTYRREVIEVEAAAGIGSVISRTVSLERFECGSWASSAIVSDGGGHGSLYFDLPMELIIRSSVDDATSPVASAFLFDNACRSRPPPPRFSASSRSPPSPSTSTCNITPRLRQARDDFNALLQAHNNL